MRVIREVIVLVALLSALIGGWGLLYHAYRFFECAFSPEVLLFHGVGYGLAVLSGALLLGLGAVAAAIWASVNRGPVGGR